MLRFANVTDADIAASPLILAARSAVLAAAVPSFALNAVLLAVLLHHSSAKHFNSRLVLANISIAAVLSAPYVFTKSVVFLASLAMSGPPSFSVVSAECALREFANTTSNRSAVFCMLASGVERYVGTKLHRTYENRFRWFGVLISILVWASALPGSILSVIMQFKSKTKLTVPICESLLVMNANIIIAYVVLLMVADLVALALYFASMRHARNLIGRFQTSQALLSLASRMQLCHVIELNHTMFPACVLHFCANETIHAWIGLVHFVLPLSPTAFIAANVFVYAAIQAYFAAHALLVLIRYSGARSMLVTILYRLQPKVDNGAFVVRLRQSLEQDKVRKISDSIALQRSNSGGANPYGEFLANYWDTIHEKRQRPPTAVGCTAQN